jgi:two-component system, OmpR family, response regulator ResD
MESKKKILIVDDHERLRMLVLATFKGNDDYHMIEASSGEDAIRLATSETPDLILMDLMMPGKFDGLEATRILKNDQNTQNIPIVFLTAKGQESDIDQGYQAGANDYIIKPFSPTELIQKVEKLLL